MVRKQGNQQKQKNSLASKKTEIEKLVEASKNKAQVRLPPQQSKTNRNSPSSQAKAPPPRKRRQLQPKKIVPDLGPDHRGLVLDVRHELAPGIPLIRLPCEPTTPRALRCAPEGPFPFLRLPGELRNKIYEWAITKHNYTIEWVNGSHKSKCLTYRLPRLGKAFEPRLQPGTARRRRELDYERRAPSQKKLPVDCINAGPAALLSVCRQLNKEASTVFYSKSTFTFHGLGALRSFLDRLSPLSKESITRLAIIYRQYGNPERTEDSPWKTEHDRLWERLCWRVADECVSLTHLTLDLTLNKSPISFVPFDEAGEEGLGAQWIKPLWAFQDVGIERCWGRIRCSSKARSVLEVESWKMRKEILGDRWDDEAEAHRDPYGFRASGHDKQAMKRGMVLRLRADGTVEGV